MLYSFWLQCIGTKTAFFVLFIILKVAFEPFHMGLTFESEDMGADAIKEKAVVRDDYSATGEINQCVLQCTQGFHIKVVGGFIKQQYIATGFQQSRHMHPVAFPTRQEANFFLLIPAFEVKRRTIGARVDFSIAQPDNILTITDRLPDRCIGIQIVT